jgi:beta-glucosidase
MAAARDPDLVRRVARATAREMRATGAVQNYAPTADVLREPRWGRAFETYGESPRLCATLVRAEVEGYRAGDDAQRVLATPKHFPAYGGPERGEDTAPVDVSPSTLHRVFLPPFAAAFDAGAGAVMPCYNAIDGEPAHGSARFLTGLLRERLGFDGISVSDWTGVRMLHEDHRVTPDAEASTRTAYRAGLDVTSVGGPAAADRLRTLVEAGELSEARVDESVRRVLQAKADLGLFEDPYVDPGAADESLGSDDHRDLAREAARRTMTLLENDPVDGSPVLPFPPELDEVLVCGPNADNVRNQVGGWSVPEASGTTVLEGVEAVTGAGTTVTHEPGAGIAEAGDVDSARAAAADAEAAVVVLGESWYIHEFGPSELAGDVGSFPTRSELALPDAQRDLLEAVLDTGTPTALVLVAGRPLAIPWAAEHAPAILAAYYPGSEGGLAVAETLFGRSAPSGTLPASIPRSAGHLPTLFDRAPNPTPIGGEEHPPSYDPLYPFGHGLTYTEFAYRDLDLSAGTIGTGGVVEARVAVENVGERPGTATVHVSVRDEVSSRVTPARELAGVDRLALDPGERGTARVSIPVESFGVVGRDGERTVEPGTYAVVAGEREATFAVESDYS